MTLVEHAIAAHLGPPQHALGLGLELGVEGDPPAPSEGFADRAWQFACLRRLDELGGIQVLDLSPDGD